MGVIQGVLGLTGYSGRPPPTIVLRQSEKLFFAGVLSFLLLFGTATKNLTPKTSEIVIR